MSSEPISASPATLSEMLTTLRRGWRWIGGITLAALFLAALWMALSKPLFRARATILLEQDTPSGLLGELAMLASIGAGARRGLLIKGGRHLEVLAQADVLLLDKTGTLTLGRPEITDIVPLNGVSADEVLVSAASAERYSEHPLAEATRVAARERGVPLGEPQDFQAIPGRGVTFFRC